MRPTDLDRIVSPTTLAFQGELLLTAVTRPDLSANTYRTSLARVGPDGVEAWTLGPRDGSPAISPDGRWVAFTRASKDGPAQLYVMPATGGEARRLTDLPLGAGAPVWAPDSRRIAFVARIPEAGRYGTASPGDDTGAPSQGEEAPRRITRYDYRLDDVGFVRDRMPRLFVVDVGAVPQDAPLTGDDLAPLTDGRAEVSDPAWTPAGDAIVVVAPRDWDERETLHSDLYAVPVDGGNPRPVVRCAGACAAPVIADDGTVFFYGTEFDGFVSVARDVGLWAATLPENGEAATPRRLTDAESVDCDISVGAPVPRGEHVLVVVRNRGAAELRSVPRTADAAELETLPVLAGERAAVRAFAVDGERIAMIQAGPTDAGEVLLLGADGTTRRLTDLSAPLRESGVRQAEEVTATAPDGYPVHGWVVAPDGDGPHPVLLVIHGGPFSAYEWSMFDEAQVYASAGYLVVLANPRGSAGYGQSHGEAIVGALGTVDADDLLALLDAVLARPDADVERVGVMGGSYGGFMAGWLAAHHGDRFRAAWSERAVNAWDSFTGSSDIGWFFTAGYVADDPAEQRRRSPLTHAHKIAIPFAVVHSEQDWRCPLEQAQRMFVALKKNGTETEMLLFPGEGHELTRSGSPRHRVQRFEAVLDWWGRHLTVS